MTQNARFATPVRTLFVRGLDTERSCVRHAAIKARTCRATNDLRLIGAIRIEDALVLGVQCEDLRERARALARRTAAPKGIEPYLQRFGGVAG